MNPPFRLHAPLLTPRTKETLAWHPRGAVAVDEHGRILYGGAEDALPEALLALPSEQLDDILIPGLIDAHVHLPQYDCRGKFGASLLEWLDRFIYPEEQRFADEAVARDIARRFFAGLLRAGTTTAMVYATVHPRATHIAFEEAERSGLRIIMGNVLMDREAPPALCVDAETSIRASEGLIEAWHGKDDRLFYAITPRFAPTCTPGLLRDAGVLAEKHGTWIQTHLNETAGEIARVRELFPDARDYTDVYDQAGLLTGHSVLGHNLHTDDVQLDVLRKRGCAVAHCPDSNLFLGSGRFPLEQHGQHELRIALGSDVGAGTTLSLFQIMRSMSYVQDRSLHPRIPFYHATLGGAAALGFADRIGSLEAGKQADMVAVHVDRHFPRGKSLDELSSTEIASALVYRTQEAAVRRLWLGGREISLH